MRLLYVAKNLMDAHLVAGLLESNGIQAYVGNESLWGVRGEVGMDAGSAPNVSVRDEDHARAKQLLGEDLPGGACRR
ncbi:MAG: DUF2007 domain-containing protein [Planctomycetes bacterium]|nr:DUF2007 domain-containing protein [Planctomycetota bacterium]